MHAVCVYQLICVCVCFATKSASCMQWSITRTATRTTSSPNQESAHLLHPALTSPCSEASSLSLGGGKSTTVRLTANMPLDDLRGIKALTFDVFGTVVDWRSTVEAALRTALATKLASVPQHEADRIQRALAAGAAAAHPQCPQDVAGAAAAAADGGVDWAAPFAQEWRNAYKAFTRSFRAGQTSWKDIDTHHHDSLVDQLHRWGLADVFTASEIRDLSLVWHRLAPWPDAARGLGRLGELGLVTATLSNGNLNLLADLNNGSGGGSGGHGDEDVDRPKLGFARIFSAEDFGAYKPDPKTYLGAVEKLGVAPGETAMVACHLNDLDAARALHLRTIYVERAKEEDWDPAEERYQRARHATVDLWVPLDPQLGPEGGFVEVARQLETVLGSKQDAQ